jgi:hypothetical protein
VLEKDFLSERISQLLSNTIAKHEFSQTFLTKHVSYPAQENIEESKIEEIKEADDSEIRNSRPQNLKIKKDQLKPKKPIDEDDKSDNGLDTSVGRERPAIKVQGGDSKPIKNYFKKSKRNSFSKL